MKFECPSCGISLLAEAEDAGKAVKCPGCDTKLQIPAEAPRPKLNIPTPSGVRPPDDTGASPENEGEAGTEYYPPDPQKHDRRGWDESDHTNPSSLVSLGLGAAGTAIFLLMVLPFDPKPELPSSEYNFMQYIASIWTSHLAVNCLNTLFFFWAMAILLLKYQKLRLQRRALLLDVLPSELGSVINADTVGSFIDHIYKLPRRLRDSLMVNRIRKGLELFEVKQSKDDAVTLMSAQSDIDSSRIGVSYSLVKAFLWAIPIMGFVGTVMGLSEALLSLNFDNLDDVTAIIGVLKGVINGLGAAFDATLVGLLLAMLLNFPMNGLAKAEDDTLNDVDSFCNEILIPRFEDGSHGSGGDMGAMMGSLSRAVASAQQEFLGDLNALSDKILDHAHNLDARANAHQEHVSKEFSEALERMRTDMTGAVANSVKTTTDYTRALGTGIQSLNDVLTQLGEKQVVIQQTVKKGWFSRS